MCWIWRVVSESCLFDAVMDNAALSEIIMRFNCE